MDGELEYPVNLAIHWTQVLGHSLWQSALAPEMRKRIPNLRKN
jgi:hypothetical protein